MGNLRPSDSNQEGRPENGLNRIKTMSASGVACTGLSWSYDIWANRTAQTTTGGSCGNSSLAFDQNNRITGSGYEYDAAGNVTVNPAVGMSHQWDAEGRMKSMGGTSAVYTYDADGRRVVKTVGGTSTYYYYDIAGKVSIEKNQSNVWAVGYIYLNGQMVATYKDSTTYFAHKDHLGSTRVLTKLDKSVQDNMDYLPYGEQVSGGSTTSHKFTGHERDAESGLDYMGARYYASASGRFVSVDPSRVSIRQQDPQTWNRYSYTENRPLNHIDANGKWSTPIHDRIIDRVFGFLSDFHRSTLKVASLRVDNDQSLFGSFKHGMRAPWQSQIEAFVRGQQFIDDNLTSAVRHQMIWEEQYKPGHSDSALSYFGEALHTVTDSASPWHTNYSQAWYGGVSPTDWAHAINEQRHGPSQEGAIGMAEYQARLLWDRYQRMLEEARKKKEEEERKKKEEEERKKAEQQ